MKNTLDDKYYGVKIGYDCLDDEYFKITEYKFDCMDLAQKFKDYIVTNGYMVFPIGDVISYPPEKETFVMIPDNYVCRPIFSTVIDAILDLENMKDYKKEYEYIHEVFEMDLSEMDHIQTENKVERLEKEIKALETSNGLLKIICVMQVTFIGVLLVKVFS